MKTNTNDFIHQTAQSVWLKQNDQGYVGKKNLCFSMRNWQPNIVDNDIRETKETRADINETSLVNIECYLQVNNVYWIPYQHRH